MTTSSLRRGQRLRERNAANGFDADVPKSPKLQAVLRSPSKALRRRISSCEQAGGRRDHKGQPAAAHRRFDLGDLGADASAGQTRPAASRRCTISTPSDARCPRRA